MATTGPSRLCPESNFPPLVHVRSRVDVRARVLSRRRHRNGIFAAVYRFGGAGLFDGAGLGTGGAPYAAMGGATGEAVTDIIGAGGPPYAGAMVTGCVGCVGCLGTGCAVGCVGVGCVVGAGCVVGCGSGAVFTGAP